jgi:hypothetical protein
LLADRQGNGPERAAGSGDAGPGRWRSRLTFAAAARLVEARA